MPTTLQGRDLEKRCAELKCQGFNSVEIGKQLGISTRRASSAWSRALIRATAASDYQADQMRYVELMRLDQLHETFWGQALGNEPRVVRDSDGHEFIIREPSEKAAEIILKIQKQRLNYIPGLEVPKADIGKSNAPVQIQVNYVRQGVDGKAIDAPPPSVQVSYEQIPQIESSAEQCQEPQPYPDSDEASI